MHASMPNLGLKKVTQVPEVVFQTVVHLNLLMCPANPGLREWLKLANALP